MILWTAVFRSHSGLIKFTKSAMKSLSLFPRWIAIDSLWNRKDRSRESPDLSVNRLPRVDIRSRAAPQTGPKVSNAIGTNKWVLVSDAYLLTFLTAAASAADPAAWTEWARLVWAQACWPQSHPKLRIGLLTKESKSWHPGQIPGAVILPRGGGWSTPQFSFQVVGDQPPNFHSN